MWMQLQIPKIEDGNNFGVAVQVGKCWWFGQSVELLVLWERLHISVLLIAKGESVWAADEHTNQDRRVPNTDFKVRAYTVPSVINFEFFYFIWVVNKSCSH